MAVHLHTFTLDPHHLLPPLLLNTGERVMSMFNNNQNFHISGGQFMSNFYSVDDPIGRLYEYIKDVGAAHDAEARYPPPQCHPGTRQAVLKEIHDWIYSPEPQNHIFWLYGPAGGFLVSSFFFLRGHPIRSNAKALFLTIAHGLANSIPELREPIEEALRSDPTILQAKLEAQFQKLIVEPCMLLVQLCHFPWVIVIDGLDECKDSQELERILSILATIFPKGIPLRFLLCSRPELHIRWSFNTNTFRPYLCRAALDNTYQTQHDIMKFLTSEFQQIRNEPQHHHIPFPSPWPSPGVIDELAHKACGQFIYATTVVKFIDNPYFNPCTQLELVLHPGPQSNPEARSPFHDLDVLYHQILSCHPQPSKLKNVFWALIVLCGWQRFKEQHNTPLRIEAFLLLGKGDVISTLSGMHSILHIGHPYEQIHILHKSFEDFLLDPTQSGCFFLGDEQTRRKHEALQILHIINHYSQTYCNNQEQLSLQQWEIFWYAWHKWGDICGRSIPDEWVLNALHNFSRNLGPYIARCLYYPNSPDSHGYNLKHFFYYCMIQQFLQQSMTLLEHLQKKPNVPVKIINCFSNPMSCLCVKVSQSDIPDMILHQFMDAAAVQLAYFLVKHSLLPPLEKAKFQQLVNAYPNILDSEHFQVVCIGNDCGCPLTSTSMCLASSCYPPNSHDGLYHINLIAAIRKVLAIVLQNVKCWEYGFSTLDWNPTYDISDWLAICGPCPELLSPLSLVLTGVQTKKDQDGVLKWLQSFPPEYGSQTAPLIKWVQAIKPNGIWGWRKMRW
ncbi:nwd2 [Moniliophthora roreri MCA 2997]|uniref:Nwd2 n=2 Tax=Moniliophthora roreri TaxID=221103 RepID=V2WNK3_MONRO|nr:nwd2 [Moniliophthora roreri MCA 2997]